jgi:ABC-type polysaccharide/polyol phosphate export permease
MNPDWDNAELIALVGVAAIWAGIVWWQPAQTLVAGVDGRWSTSKTAVALWTTAVLWAFTATLIHEGGSGLSSAANELNDQYFAVLGIPVAAAVAAKASRFGTSRSLPQSRKRRRPLTPSRIP